MLQLILIIVGFFYLAKRKKLKWLEQNSPPSVPPDKCDMWRKLELRSIDIFLWTVWGLFVLSIVVTILLHALQVTNPAARWAFTAGYVVAFFGGLTVSAIYGTKAAKLKKSLGIE